LDECGPSVDSGDLTVVYRRSPALIGGEGERAWYLVVVEGFEPGRRIRLGPTPLVIGRIASAELVLQDTEVSRRHCSVQVHPSLGLAVTDFDATNGTYVDGRRIAGSVALPENAFLQIGRHVFRCERLSPAEASQVDAFAEELERARDYVRALLPAPVAEGPVGADWAFVPSAHLGGDAFGYQWLDQRHFAFHLIDVSGHGPGAALHSASIMNVLRNRTLPDTAFDRPAEVVTRLNSAFPMDLHAGMCFSIWYGVFDRLSRRLEYCSAGHHPAYLLGPGGNAPTPLQTRNVLVGAAPDYGFRSATADVSPGSRLYLFSDGVFEIRSEDGSEGTLEDFLTQLGPEAAAPAALLERARQRTAAGAFEDDFTLLCLRF
jgi:Stage II sporulation protein E (SpoIIE)/FHA domain